MADTQAARAGGAVQLGGAGSAAAPLSLNGARAAALFGETSGPLSDAQQQLMAGLVKQFQLSGDSAQPGSPQFLDAVGANLVKLEQGLIAKAHEMGIDLPTSEATLAGLRDAVVNRLGQTNPDAAKDARGKTLFELLQLLSTPSARSQPTASSDAGAPAAGGGEDGDRMAQPSHAHRPVTHRPHTAHRPRPRAPRHPGGVRLHRQGPTEDRRTAAASDPPTRAPAQAVATGAHPFQPGEAERLSNIIIGDLDRGPTATKGRAATEFRERANFVEKNALLTKSAGAYYQVYPEEAPASGAKLSG